MRRTVLAGGKQNKSHWPGLIGVSVLSLVFLLLTVGVGMYAGLTSAVDNRVLPEGTRIDGVNLGGVAADEALSIISANTDSNLDAFRIDVMGYSRDLTWTAEDVGLRCDYETLVEQAAYPEPKGSVLDTFEQYASMTAGGEYHSTVTIDETEVRRLVEVLASQVTVAPVSATAIFEPVSESFTYTADAPGQELDVEGMVAHILAGFDGENLAPIAVDMEQFLRRAEPPVTQAALMANTVLIGECMTAVTNNENRNTNIRLMCEAVDGICLLPGEQLSLNDLVGERTEEKGFRYAGAIVDGKIVDDVGGGICQLAGTLYNAVLLSDLEVVERVRHTYPSDYLPIGLDATLNWNNKDLVIANNTEYPIYFGTKLSENKVTARIYGRPIPDGVTIQLRSDVLRETEPGSTQLVMTTSLPEGQRKVRQSALNGYEVQVYKEFWQDDTLLREEKVSRDTYQPRNAIILVGSSGNK